MSELIIPVGLAIVGGILLLFGWKHRKVAKGLALLDNISGFFSLLIAILILIGQQNGKEAFFYQIHVKSFTTGEEVRNAEVRLDFDGGSLRDVTNDDGIVTFEIDREKEGIKANLHIEATGYNDREVDVLLSASNPLLVISLHLAEP